MTRAVLLRLRIAACALAGWLALTQASSAQASAGYEPDTASFIILMVVAFLIYFAPSIVAFSRSHPNRWPILGINIVFGATGSGWVGSLIWAFGAVHKSLTGSDGGESGLNLFVNDPKIVRLEGVDAVGSNDDPVVQLGRLKRLLDDGAISSEEYAALRRPLIARLSA